MENILTFSADLTADAARRTISGKIVPIGTGEIGNTSAGAVVFESGAIQLPENASSIKLLNQHNSKEPLGKATMFNEVPGEGIYASFKISNSTRGTDALILASEGLQGGLSVGVEVIKAKNKSGVMYVSAARLFEVSLVTEPAFKSAQVIDVAASDEAPAEEDVIEETKPTESEPVVESTPDTVAAPEVEASAVEAARPTVAVTNVRPRLKTLTSGEYLEANIKAAMGDDAARQLVLATDDTTTNTGLTLAPHMNEFVTTSIDGRPSVDAISKGVLPASGMSFTIPKLSTAPTIDSDSTQGEALGGTEMASTYITVDVKKAAGLQTISWELLDRSSPAFYDELIKELNYAYAKATDKAVVAAFIASGTAASTQAATIAGLKAYISKEVPAAYAAAGKFARNLVINTAWWETIMAADDTTNRPLFMASNPQNNPGNISGQSIVGDVLGLNTFVDPHMAITTLIDDSAFIVAPEAFTFYEAPKTTLQVQALANGQLQVAVYGYYAIAPKVGGGVRRFNLT
jgi:HK97 family phage major capsid protein/HK97 family phage prohead protease